eukprot:TRINITY_DN31937_c0_g1_i11.p4 TRINITY_DN31937_c0_g1~~TRINITY_DN31937_c0_g1_i11.p4  ORF type:complete len:123 (-),score=9.27 TRINITY_DN31937_c0_g1_i11:274-642(-)
MRPLLLESASSPNAWPTKSLCSLSYPCTVSKKGYLKNTTRRFQELEITLCPHPVLNPDRAILACQTGYKELFALPRISIWPSTASPTTHTPRKKTHLPGELQKFVHQHPCLENDLSVESVDT